jgi:hypothetical protein
MQAYNVGFSATPGIPSDVAQQTGRTKTDIIREYALEFGDSSPTSSPI